MFNWFGITAAQLEEYQKGIPSEGDTKLKAEQAAADAEKTPDQKLQDGFYSCKEAGRKLPRRLLGQVDRETGKMTDQFTQLEGHEEEVSKIIMDSFLEQLDIELQERGLLDEEDNEES